MVLVSLQQRHRQNRPFRIDLEALTDATHFDREEVRDQIADLVECGVLRFHGDERYVFLSSCTCPPKAHSRSAPQSTKRKLSPARRLTQHFDDRVTMLEPMGLGNAAALAKNISTWMRSGVSEAAVMLMIEEFEMRFREYCRPGTPPWKAFVARRFQILDIVQDQYRDKHQWDEGFEDQFAHMFPVVMEVTS